MGGFIYDIRRWNLTAVECYMRGCDCSGCPIYELYFKNEKYSCRMKEAIVEMVRKFGKPTERFIKELRKNER